MRNIRILFAFLLLMPLAVQAQEQAVAKQTSAWVPVQVPGPAALPEVKDGKVTFRLTAPKANEVKVWGDFPGGRGLPLAKDDKGVWTATVSVDPGIYSYKLILDGLSILDPGNPRIEIHPTYNCNLFEMPGSQPMFYDVRNVPHGVLSTLTYESKVTGDTRQVAVYTPPGYGADASAQFPVLYLVHGHGDDESSWSQIGFAHHIADNLLAEGKMKPMIIAMPNAHASRPEDRERTAPGAQPRDSFKAELLEEIIPLVEQNYRVKPGAKNRGIAGPSRGGAHAITIGLNNLDKFGCVAVFSAYQPENAYPGFLANPKAANEMLSLFWIGCGRQDTIFADMEKMVAAFKEAGINHVWHPTEGKHAWPVFRDDLHEVLPLMFRQ